MSYFTFRALLPTVAGLLASLTVAVAQDGVWVDRGTSPTANCGGSLLAFDRARGETVWFGGQGCLETWLWNGGAWQQRTSLPAPSLGFCVGAYDATRQVVVTVTGNHSTGLQTWEWDGVAWQQRGTGPSPARDGFGLAFDEARGVTVLFGGNAGNTSNSLAETWTWDGTGWTLVMQGGPVPRSYPGMTYDVQQQTVLLFGGQGQFNGVPAFFADTWEWNGAQWIAHFGISAPPARSAPGLLAYDRLRNRTLLQGGFNSSGSLHDTWEWNGSAWAPLQPLSVPTGYAAGVVADDARGVMVTVTDSLFETWEYVPGAAVPATFATYGSGCAGPAGVPSLSNVGGSLPRIGSTLQLQMTNLPSSVFSAAIGFVGFDATSWGGIPLPLSLAPFGFPGCDALLAPFSSYTLTNAGGVANWNIAMPMTTLALGADVFFQGAVFVPGWNLGGFVFSNGGHAVVGSP